MLLQRLCEYADRLNLPPTLYAEGPVRYVIELDTKGNLLNPVPTDTADPSSRATRRGARRLVPQVVRSSAVRPLLLADKADYVLGYTRPGQNEARVSDCHSAFVDLITRCAEETGEPSVEAVRRFLLDRPLEHLQLPEDFDPGDIITFRVDGIFPIDLPSVQEFWAREHDPGRRSAPLMNCLVCGKKRPVLSRLQGKIKGLPGGQTSGTSLISANANAFESYGLSESLVAPTCAYCAERFTKAINALQDSEANSLRLGDGAVCLFWTRKPVQFSLRTYLDNPQPEDVAALLRSVQFGHKVPDLDESEFFAVVLRANGGRAAVRDWIDTTVGEVRRRLASWFQRQAIVQPNGAQPSPLGLFRLAAATVRDPTKDLSPLTTRSLLRSALTGAPVPDSLLQQAVARNHAEQLVTRPRAALIKLVLAGHNYNMREDSMVALDPDNPDIAYHCGRLFAELEHAQRAAIGTETVVSRFFGSASSAPASVFGRLLRGVQPHLSKLQRDQPGTYWALQNRLEEILALIPAFPRTLTLHEQGLFALGYYHQRAHDRARAREAAERGEINPKSTDENDVVGQAKKQSKEE